MKKDNIFSTKQREGMERALAFVMIFQGSHHVDLLCHSWGKIGGVQFFDTPSDQHVELHGDFSFILHIPPQDSTFDPDGTLRELREDATTVTLQ